MEKRSFTHIKWVRDTYSTKDFSSEISLQRENSGHFGLCLFEKQAFGWKSSMDLKPCLNVLYVQLAIHYSYGPSSHSFSVLDHPFLWLKRMPFAGKPLKEHQIEVPVITLSKNSLKLPNSFASFGQATFSSRGKKFLLRRSRRKTQRVNGFASWVHCLKNFILRVFQVNIIEIYSCSK